MIKQLLAPLASLKLAVALLALSMLLVLAGTVAQVDAGIWTVQKRYFHTLFTWIDFQVFFPRPEPGQRGIPGGFPMLGGYGLGLLILINLAAALLMRFRYEWKRVGVLLIHGGLILLLIGEGMTSTMAVESQVVLSEGESTRYSQDIREVELAIIDPSPADHDNVAAIPGPRIVREGTISHPRLPFGVRVDDFYANSAIFEPKPGQMTTPSRATKGTGVGLGVMERPRVSGTDGRSTDVPSAFITFTDQGRDLGTYLLSPFFDAPQQVQVGDKSYLVQLRWKRYYKPYTLQLLDFSHDRYTGTNQPKNFSSRVRLTDPTRHEDREVKIWMNHPLRYAGETFYQSGYNGEQTTILQVVKNPGWLMPYIACTVGGLGMLIHFGLHLIGFVRRRSAGASVAPATARGPAYALPAGGPTSWLFRVGVALAALALAYGASRSFQPVPKGDYDLAAFGRLPVSFEGRVQPMDSLARNGLKMLNQRETLRTDAGKTPAIQWLMDVFANPEKRDQYRFFRIDHPDVINVLGLDPDRHLFSPAEIGPRLSVLEEQHRLASQVDPQRRSLYQRKVLELAMRWDLFYRLTDVMSLYTVPPSASGQDWQPLGHVISHTRDIERLDPAVVGFISTLKAYNEKSPATFNRAVADYGTMLQRLVPPDVTKARFEAMFNRFDPFLQCMMLYVLVFILACCSWLGWTRRLSAAALSVLLGALVLHTLGLIGRIYISGRPPVTNLASSAIFIAWGTVVMAAILEGIYRNGIGSVCAATIGFVSLLISHSLSLDGDTMKVLQAVLDTNFWLASHVVTITLGYAATFLAGFLGILYVVRGVFTRSLSRHEAGDLSRMIYGIVCFAMLLSFVGTVLGGIWADQSWGRFWGWDPKENGAALIVLWNAIILHARWGGLIRQRGLALLAIFGNVVTAWSWFGTNMLSVGLHSYGFMDKAIPWMLGFVFSQLLLMAIGGIPLPAWRSAAAMGHDSSDPAQRRATDSATIA